MPTDPQGRLERWKRGLLDLSLRNPLLNHRKGRRSVPLRVPDASLLEDRLAGGEGFRLVALPRPADGAAPDVPEEALRAEIEAGRLPADLAPEALAEALTTLDRAARSSLEESGANTLFLALGWLTWFESEASPDERRAPLLLVPVRLVRAGATQAFRLEHFEEDALPNVALFQMLRVDFGLEVTGLEEAASDVSGVDVAALLERVRALVAAQPRWRVTAEGALGLFSFTKYLMWLDLERNPDRLRGNAVVKHLLETPTLPFAPGTVLPDPGALDRDRPVAASLSPLEADSSQLAAVCAAVEGATFVLEGPPGTGKSQTIANLVAHALAAGKRVLFVSEKMAALDVVFRRLSAIGLGPWCLELHSTKAQRSRLVEQLRESLEAPAPAAVPDFDADARRLGLARDEILISVCYGPDASGRVALGFGPLNAEGGERRLNVVVTRAREQVVVFSTLRADQIDLGRTSALAVAHLRAYLEFAAAGAPALAPDAPRVRSDGAGLEAQVADALRARGHPVDVDVGCSGYRIDVAVRDPDRPGRWLLGVECDGAMYASAATARDRDRLRAQVLASLGWRLVRVWSTDWWTDREAVLSRIDEALLVARNAPLVAPPPPAPPPPAPPTPVSPPGAPTPQARTPASPSTNRGAEPYVVARPAGGTGGADALCHPRAAGRLGQAVLAVLEQEAPVALDVLVRRVAAAWDVSRVTDRVRAAIEGAVGGAVRRTTSADGTVFLWGAAQDPATWERVRGTTADGEAPREAGEIPPEEVAAAARGVLDASLGLPLDAWVRETARRFGLRPGPGVVAALEPHVRSLVARGVARLDGGQATLASPG